MLLHIYSSRRNIFVLTKISYLQPFREIMGGQRIRKFSAKMTPQAKKMTFFRIFSLLLHIYTSRRNFFVAIKISYLQPFREIMGRQKNVNFRLKMTPQAKNDFFQNFLLCCTSTHRDETFLLLSNLHIFSRSEKSWGGQKALQQTNKQQTNDHKTPPGFSESSG